MTKKMLMALVAMVSVATLAGCGTNTEEVVVDEVATGEVVEVLTGSEMINEEVATGEVEVMAETTGDSEFVVEVATGDAVVADEVAAQ